jgi:hypothetical protein
MISNTSTQGHKVQLTLATTSQDYATKCSVVKWELKLINNIAPILDTDSKTYTVVVDNKTYTGNTTINIGKNDSKLIASDSLRIYHNDNGLKTINCSFSLQLIGQTVTANGSEVLTRIPLAIDLMSAPNFNDEANPVIIYQTTTTPERYQKLQACISLTGSKDDIAYRDVAINGSTYTFNLTEAERNVLREATKNNITRTVKFYLKTIFDNESVQYRNKTVNFSVINCEPTISPSVEDSNARTLELTGDKNKFIKYFSNGAFTVGAAAKKGAAINHRSIQNGTQKLEDYTSNTGTINAIESNTFYFSATDSRGLTVNGFKVVELIPYVRLTSSLTTTPMTTNGALTFTIKGKYFSGSFGAKSNSLEVEYALKNSSGNYVGGTESGWIKLGTVSPSVSGSDYSYSYTITGLSYNEQYELTVNAIDELTPVQTTTTVIATTPLFDWSDTDFHHHTEVFFSDDIYIKGEKVADYVIEEGVSGSWHYRKWASGRADLTGSKEIVNLACNTALGGWYRTAVQSSPNFPFSIINPIVTVTYESAGFGALVWATTNTNTSKPFDFYLIRPTSSTAITGKVNYSVSGSWKGVA